MPIRKTLYMKNDGFSSDNRSQYRVTPLRTIR